MGYIDDYLANLQNRTQSRGMNPSVSTGEPSRTNQAITSSTLPSNVNAIGSYQSLQEKQDPKLDIISGQQEQARSSNAMQQAYVAPPQVQQADPNKPLVEAGVGTVANLMQGAAKNEAPDMSLQRQSKIDSLYEQANNATDQATYDQAVSELEAMNQSSQSAGMQAVGAAGSAVSGLNSFYNILQGSTKPQDYFGVAKSGVDAVNYAGNAYNAYNAAQTGLQSTNALAGTGSALGAVGTAAGYVGAAISAVGGIAQAFKGGEEGMGHTNAREGTNNVVRGIMSVVQPVYGLINGAFGLANSIIKPNQTGQDIMSILNPSGLLSGQYNGSHQYGVLRSIDQGLDRIGNSIADVFGTVVCTQLHAQKRISKEVYKADGRFGKMMDESEYLWYLSWGTKIAQRMAFSQLYSSIIAFFFVPISKYMAWEMGVGKGSTFGKLCFKTLQLLHKVVGRK